MQRKNTPALTRTVSINELPKAWRQGLEGAQVVLVTLEIPGALKHNRRPARRALKDRTKVANAERLPETVEPPKRYRLTDWIGAVAGLYASQEEIDAEIAHSRAE